MTAGGDKLSPSVCNGLVGRTPGQEVGGLGSMPSLATEGSNPFLLPRRNALKPLVQRLGCLEAVSKHAADLFKVQ